MEKLTMTVMEAAQALGVSRPIAYELANREDFPSVRVGRRLLVSVEGLREWVKMRTESRDGAGGGEYIQ